MSVKNTKDKPPAPPSHLKAAGKRLWANVAETFDLEEHDFVLLRSLCETLDKKDQAERELRRHKTLTFKNKHGEWKSWPEVAIARDCNVLIARLRRELCLSEEEPAENRPPALKFGGK